MRGIDVGSFGGSAVIHPHDGVALGVGVIGDRHTATIDADGTSEQMASTSIPVIAVMGSLLSAEA